MSYSGKKANMVASGAEHIENHETSGGFTIGTGDADDFESASGKMLTGSGYDSLGAVVGKGSGIVERQV